MVDIAPKLVKAIRRLNRLTSGLAVDSVNTQVHNLGNTVVRVPETRSTEIDYQKDYYDKQVEKRENKRSKLNRNLTQKTSPSLSDSERNSLRKLKQIKPTQ